MSKTATILDALHRYVEQEYAKGISAPYGLTFLEAVLALSAVGFSETSRMIDLASAMLNSLNSTDRAAVLTRYSIPSPVMSKIGAMIVWPEPRTILDDLTNLTPEEEVLYRAQLEASINYHSEKQAARVITFGVRKQHAYLMKEAEAKALLSLANPAMEDPENWPYLNSEVIAGFNSDIVDAATAIVAISSDWRKLNADIEAITRTGALSVRTLPTSEISVKVNETNEQVTETVDTFLATHL